MSQAIQQTPGTTVALSPLSEDWRVGGKFGGISFYFADEERIFLTHDSLKLPPFHCIKCNSTYSVLIFCFSSHVFETILMLQN